MAVYTLPSANLDWQKSRSCEGGQCIIVARDKDSVIFGNSADPGGPAYSYTMTEWEQFVIGVKQGDFDGIA
jgi:predicted secreted Zn-dependent protease